MSRRPFVSPAARSPSACGAAWPVAALGAAVLAGVPLAPASLAAQQPTDPFERSFSGVVNEDRETTSGAAWADFDGDGDLDLFVSAYLNRDNFLYENLGADGFRRVTSALPASDAGLSSGAAWADIDNDGLDDLFVANQRGQDNFLYRNRGGATFERVEGPVQRDRGDSYAGAWADYDLDGHVDLFVANRSGQPDFLYRNLGGGRFERIREGPIAEAEGSSFTGAWADVDGDGLPDLLVLDSDPEAPSSLYRNLGGGRFARVDEGPIAVDAASSSRAAFGDYDNDGDLDLFVTNGGFFGGSEQVPFLYRNDDGRLVRVLTGPPVSRALSGSDAVWLDVDDDGDLDLFVAVYRDDNLLFRNDEGRFTRVTSGWAVDHAGFTDAAAVADHDRDGDLDLYLTHWEGQNDVLLTNGGNGNHWLAMDLEGVRSNRSAFGATVRATATIAGREVTQLRVVGIGLGGRGQGARQVHFGLGDATEVRRLEIRWPSGEETILDSVPADGFLAVREGEGVVDREEPAPVRPPPSAGNVVLRAFLDGGVEGALEAYRDLQGRVAAADRASGLAAAARYIFDGVDREGGLALVRAALEEAAGFAAVTFTAAELHRGAGHEDRARELYRRTLGILEADPAADPAEEPAADPDLRRWMERVSRRYAEPG